MHPYPGSGPAGARRSTVRTVKARMGAVPELAASCTRRIQVVTLGARATTGASGASCWRPPGWRVQLVNAAQARNLPGRPKRTR